MAQNWKEKQNHFILKWRELRDSQTRTGLKFKTRTDVLEWKWMQKNCWFREKIKRYCTHSCLFGLGYNSPYDPHSDIPSPILACTFAMATQRWTMRKGSTGHRLWSCCSRCILSQKRPPWHSQCLWKMEDTPVTGTECTTWWREGKNSNP